MIDIVIVTYNRKDLLTQLLKKIQEQTYKQVNVIVCDDGSNDPINPSLFPCIKKYIWTVDNGYHRVARFNEGIGYCPSDKVILLDDDTIPVSNNWLQTHFNNLTTYPISRGIVRFSDGGINAVGGWFSTTNTGFQISELRKIGCMDYNYDGCYGGEDVDLGLTIRKAGLISSPFNPESTCNHLGKEYKDGDRSDAVVGRNRKYFQGKWGHDWVNFE